MLRSSLSLLALAALVSLSACQATKDVANTAVDGVEDGAQAVAGVAGTVAGAVADAAGATYGAVADVFDDDPDLTAAALIRPTSAPGARAQGTVRFREDDDRLEVTVSLSGLAPGQHGLHIHQNPACGVGEVEGRMEPGGAAGGHWDPMDTMDHGAPTDDMDAKHLGDMGDVTADASGNASATFTVEPFPSDQSIVGHSVIVHANRDDLTTDPGGNSGGRLGCGVIEGRM